MPKTKTGWRVSSPAPAEPGEELGRERLDQSVDEPVVLGRVVAPAAPAALFEGQGVGLFEAGGGLGVVAAGVRDVGQAEQQVPRGSSSSSGSSSREQTAVPVRIRQPAAQQVRQAGQQSRGFGVGRVGPPIAGSASAMSPSTSCSPPC